MTLVVLLIYFSDQFVAPEIRHSTEMSLQFLSTINTVFCDEDKILMKSLYLNGYTAKRLTGEFPEKRWTKCGVNKLLKSCGTQAQLTGGQSAADCAVPALKTSSSAIAERPRDARVTSIRFIYTPLESS